MSSFDEISSAQRPAVNTLSQGGEKGLESEYEAKDNYGEIEVMPAGEEAIVKKYVTDWMQP